MICDRETMICDIKVGRDGDEWFALISYTAGKVVEFREPVLEDIFLALTKEMEDVA